MGLKVVCINHNYQYHLLYNYASLMTKLVWFQLRNLTSSLQNVVHPNFCYSDISYRFHLLPGNFHILGKRYTDKKWRCIRTLQGPASTMFLITCRLFDSSQIVSVPMITEIISSIYLHPSHWLKFNSRIVVQVTYIWLSPR